MQPQVIVRDVREEEHAHVGRLVLAAYDGVGAIEGDYREFMADTGRRIADGAAVWVAEHDGRVIGTVTYVALGDVHFENDGHGDAGFRLLGVDPGAQGLGAGRALVDACLARARADRRRRIAIYSMEWMPVAHRMYARMGFERRPDRDVTFPSGIGRAFQYDLTADAGDHFPPPGPVADPPPWYTDELVRPPAQPTC